MPHRTSVGGRVHMSRGAWEKIESHGFNGTQTLWLDLSQTCETIEGPIYNARDSAVEFDIGGGGAWEATLKLMDLLAAVKDTQPIDVLYGTDHEEFSEYCFYVWSGGWTSKQLVAPPRPDQVEIDEMVAVDGVIQFVPGEGAVHKHGSITLGHQPAVENGRLVRRLGRPGQNNQTRSKT